MLPIADAGNALRFCPERERARLLGPFGILMRLAESPEEAYRRGMLTASAQEMVQDACLALLVGGFDREALALLRQAERFLAASKWLPLVEDQAQHGWGACRLLCHWLLHGKVDREAASRQLVRDLANPLVTLEQALPHAVLACEYWHGLELYEHQFGARLPDLGRPFTVAAYSYAICRHWLYDDFTPVLLRGAWERHYAIQAADWLAQRAMAALVGWNLLAVQQDVAPQGFEAELNAGALSIYIPVVRLRGVYDLLPDLINPFAALV